MLTLTWSSEPASLLSSEATSAPSKLCALRTLDAGDTGPEALLSLLQLQQLTDMLHSWGAAQCMAASHLLAQSLTWLRLCGRGVEFV